MLDCASFIKATSYSQVVVQTVTHFNLQALPKANIAMVAYVGMLTTCLA